MYLKIWLCDESGLNISAFEQGHMSIGNEQTKISSTDEDSCSMMVFVSVANLLEGLEPILQKQSTYFHFIGVGSKFQINFTRNRTSMVRVSIGNKYEEWLTTNDLARCIYHECLSLYNKYNKNISDENLQECDLQIALTSFKNIMNSMTKVYCFENENLFVQRFIKKKSRTLVLKILKKKDRELKLKGIMGNHSLFDSRWVHALPQINHNAQFVFELLNEKGAPKFCQMISTDTNLDQERMPLKEALTAIVGKNMSNTIVICLPEKLAYFEGSSERSQFVLSKTTNS